MFPVVRTAESATLKVGALVSVTAPKVRPAVPVTLSPFTMLSVCAPMESVPSVCVTLVPEVIRFDSIVALPETVVAVPP